MDVTQEYVAGFLKMAEAFGLKPNDIPVKRAGFFDFITGGSAKTSRADKKILDAYLKDDVPATEDTDDSDMHVRVSNFLKTNRSFARKNRMVASIFGGKPTEDMLYLSAMCSPEFMSHDLVQSMARDRGGMSPAEMKDLEKSVLAAIRSGELPM